MDPFFKHRYLESLSYPCRKSRNTEKLTKGTVKICGCLALQENYDEPFVRMVYGSPLMTTMRLLAGDQPNLDPVRVQYRDKESFKSQAKLLGIMDDLKASGPARFPSSLWHFTELPSLYQSAPNCGCD